MANARAALRWVWSLVALDIGWFACVLGAAWDVYWLGVVVVPGLAIVHILVVGTDRLRALVSLAVVALIVGLVLDTALIAAGTYEPQRWLLPAPLTTIWLLMLWLNFALALDECLRWFQDHLVAAALAGAVFGPSAYLAADRLGAARIADPVAGRLLLVSLAWLIAMPLMSRVARSLGRCPDASERGNG